MKPQRDIWIACGAVLAGLSVVLAAIGDHVLKWQRGPTEIRLFELAVRYQFYHAVALILCGIIAQSGNYRGLHLVGFGFLLGICGFCGGLFLKVVLPTVSLGLIIPAGAVLWALSWLGLALSVLMGRASDSEQARP